MGWGGIQNLPPGFDVFEGKQPPPNIVDEAARGKVPGLSPAREPLFADLKRNLLHQDYLRYFDSCVVCARALLEIEDGKYAPRVEADLLAPALTTALGQLEAIRAEVEAATAAHRRLPYDPLPSMGELFRRSQAIATAFPRAPGAAEFSARAEALLAAVRAAVPSDGR